MGRCRLVTVVRWRRCQPTPFAASQYVMFSYFSLFYVGRIRCGFCNVHVTLNTITYFSTLLINNFHSQSLTLLILCVIEQFWKENFINDGFDTLTCQDSHRGNIFYLIFVNNTNTFDGKIKNKKLKFILLFFFFFYKFAVSFFN